MANRYNKALKHLKNKNIDEKLELLEQIPTNNTTGLYVDVPGTFEPEEIGPGDLPSGEGLNLAEDGGGAEGYTGNDTTGLFLADGTIKSVEPPGDTSYVLGPMISMWYAWANYTQIGYVRQSDRKMVNLGRITGELDAWDGSSGFTSYGQLSIEQAVWYKGQSRADYRAFYPGPPSNPADQYGRYIGSIISSSKSTQTIIPAINIPGINRTFDPNDVLSLLINKFGEGFNFLKDLIGDLGNEAAKLFNGLTDGLNLLNDVKSVLDRAEQTNSILPPGHELGDPNFPDRPTLVPGSKGSRENPLQRTLSDTTNATLMNGITRDMSPSELRAQVQKNINSDFNFGAKGTLNNLTSDPYFDSEGNLIIKDTYAFSPGGDIADKPFLFGGTTGDFAKNFSDDPERQKDVLTMFDKSVGALIPGTPGRKDPVVHFEIKISPPNPEVQARQDFQKTMSMDNFNKLSKSDQNKIMDTMEKQHVSRSDGSNFKGASKYMKNRFKAAAKEAGKTKFKDGYMIDKDPNTGKSRKTPIFSTIPGRSSVLALGHVPSGKLLTENQKRIIREIKKPVEVKEMPTKFKVKPTGRKNKSVGVDMMKIPDVPKQYKPQTNIWGKADYAANVRSSQEKKNEVLELVGAAEHHWTYLTEDRRKQKQEKINEMMSAEFDKQMELLYEKHRIKESKITKAMSAFKKPTDIAPEYPKEPPPQLDPNTGMHPKFGKNYKHDKLDPQSAEAMPPTGNPEIDANVKKATNAKEKARKLKILLGKLRNLKGIAEGMTSSGMFNTTLPAQGDVDLEGINNNVSSVGSNPGYSESGNDYTFGPIENPGENPKGSSLSMKEIDATKYDTISFDFSAGTIDEFYMITGSPAPFGANSTYNLSSGSGRKTITLKAGDRLSKLAVAFHVQRGGESDLPVGTNRITNLSFQRRTPINVFVSLDSPEATSFIRTDPSMQGLSAEERIKKLIDMLDAGDEYLLKYLGLIGSKARPSDVTMPDSWEQAAGNQDTQVASAKGPYGTPGADKPYVRKGYKDKDGKFVDYDNPATWPSILKKAGKKQKTMVAHHEPKGKVLSEKKSFKDLTKKIPGYYDGKPAPLGFPMQEPPKMKNGFHPDLVDGKKVANRFNRLDPQSAKAMPPTGNPHIDKKVRAAAKKPK